MQRLPVAVAVEDNAVTEEEEDFDEEELVGYSTRFHSSGVTCEAARMHTMLS